VGNRIEEFAVTLVTGQFQLCLGDVQGIPEVVTDDAGELLETFVLTSEFPLAFFHFGDIAEEPDAAEVGPVVGFDRGGRAIEHPPVRESDLIPAVLAGVVVEFLDQLLEFLSFRELVLDDPVQQRPKGVYRRDRPDVRTFHRRSATRFN